MGMSIVNVYDINFNLIGVVDSYISIIWRPSYYDIGDFEIYMTATKEYVELFDENRLVARNIDTSIDENGNSIYRNVMIIKNVEIKTDVEKGDFLVITGRELKFMLHQRIVWNQTNLSGNLEQELRRLVDENAINPVKPERKLENLALGSLALLDETIEKQITGEYLDKSIIDICASYNIGWEVIGINHKHILLFYKGIDRSFEQSERPYVVFSDEFENLFNTEYQKFTEEYANTALIGGDGEGIDRVYNTVNDSASGFDRYETFVDARDLSRNLGTEDEIPIDVYKNMLIERGKEKLSELQITDGFSGEVLSDANFKYGEDFFLGDIVTVINKYGISKNVYVLSAIESEDEDGKVFLPQFNV